MTDIDRYITDEIVALRERYVRSFGGHPWEVVEDVLEAELPQILARHRAAVLREMAAEAYGRATEATSEDSSWRGVWRWLHRLADEAVADER